jgi:hypothetical protein
MRTWNPIIKNTFYFPNRVLPSASRDSQSSHTILHISSQSVTVFVSILIIRTCNFPNSRVSFNFHYEFPRVKHAEKTLTNPHSANHFLQLAKHNHAATWVVLRRRINPTIDSCGIFSGGVGNCRRWKRSQCELATVDTLDTFDVIALMNLMNLSVLCVTDTALTTRRFWHCFKAGLTARGWNRFLADDKKEK